MTTRLGLDGTEEEALEDERESAAVLGRLGERGGKGFAEVAAVGPSDMAERGDGVKEL